MAKIKKSAGRTLKIGITGPESSGKTWMARHLADRFNDVWLPEYAREYLMKTGGEYGINDLHIIAKEQLHREKEYLNKSKNILFCDTDIVVLKIWFAHKFKTV
ncbi:MAG: ATP-binding protein, partial [Cyclobacteriaceae bacterium]